MEILKSWKVHVFAIIIVIICELIGTKQFKLGPGVLLFLPMLYAMVIGAVVSLPKFKLLNLSEMNVSAKCLGIATLMLIAKLGVLMGPNLIKLMQSGLALSLQELGHFFGTILFGLPLALLLGGILAVYVGFDDIQDKMREERQKQYEKLEKARAEIESIRAQAEQYREELDRMKETTNPQG